MHSDGNDQKILPLGSKYKWLPEDCPDGSTFLLVGLYSGVPKLLHHELNGVNPEPFVSNVSRQTPRCTSGGKWAVYVAADKLWKVPINGGAPIQFFFFQAEDGIRDA